MYHLLGTCFSWLSTNCKECSIKGKSDTFPLFNDPGVLSTAPNMTKLFARIFSKDYNLYNASSISLLFSLYNQSETEQNFRFQNLEVVLVFNQLYSMLSVLLALTLNILLSSLNMTEFVICGDNLISLLNLNLTLWTPWLLILSQFKRISFDPPWNDRETNGFLMISGAILEAKFGDNPLLIYH